MALRGGDGPPVLLLHGHPQTHVTWHEVAPRLVAAGYTVVAADLRGYGDSSRPEGGDDHVAYSKRAMAADQVAVMRTLGHESFAVVGHDRGGRVAHRMALDHPEAVRRIAVLDIAPTATMYARTDREFATRYFWWFFLIQPAPLPERMIEADPEFYLRHHLAGQSRTPGVPREALVQEYLRCYRQPGARPRHLRGLSGGGDDRPGARRRRCRPPRRGAAAGAVGCQGRGRRVVRRAGNLARQGHGCPRPRPALRPRAAGGTAGGNRRGADRVPAQGAGTTRP